MSFLAAQDQPNVPVHIEKLKVVREGKDMLVELNLSHATTPSVEIATNPDRIVVILPNTISLSKQQRVAINLNGLQTIRIGLNSAEPPVTRVVLDLDSAHPYEVATEGAKITLKVQPGTATPAVSGARRSSPPPAATSGPFVGMFHRGPKSSHPVSDDGGVSGVPAPPPSRPPISFPASQGAAATASSEPSGAHPNYGSLQQGVAYPGLGAPGAGSLPKAANNPGPAQAAAGNASQVPMAPITASATGSAPAKSSQSVVSQPASAQLQSSSNSASQVSSGQPQLPAAANPQPASSKPAPPLTAASQPSPAQPSPAPAIQVSTAQQPSTAVASEPTSAPVVSAPTPALQAGSAQLQPLSPQTASVPAVATTGQLAASPSAPAPAASSLSVDTVPGTQAAASVSAPSVKSPETAVPIQAASLAPPVSSSQNSAAQTTAEADIPVLALRAVNPDLRTTFKVKYVAEGAAYLDGGRNAGLAEGMKLIIRERPSAPASPSSTKDAMVANNGIVAELHVISVAESSAVTEIHAPAREVKPGDRAFLSREDQEALVQKNTLSETRKYPTVVSFTESDTLDEEARAEIPKPPMPSVNRARGRIGFDYMGTMFHGSPGISTTDVGMIVRTDITRIGGTYWDASGYWRGRLNSTSGPSTPTLQDLINRTYHLSMTYNNPQSAWVAGFGRMYLPWASSLDTIDGGYFGRRVHPGVTLGIFAGSTPDPTSWNYNPDRRIGGTFVNFEGGSFDGFHYTSTSGMGVSTIVWKIDRPFVFEENSLSYKRYLSIYSSLQADSPAGNQAVTAPGPGIGRSFTTVRVQPFSRLEFDFNHTYFRDVPTFDPALIGTGLLDKYLFQGFSVGARVEVIKQVWIYTTQGQSNRSGDAKNSGNEAYGITFGHLPWVGLHADVHYSRFSSSFGDGTYRALSLSRSIGENFRVELMGGDQNFANTLTTNNRTRFLLGNVEAPVGRHFFLQGGYTIDRGATENYDQWMFTLGYRFDSKYDKRKK